MGKQVESGGNAGQNRNIVNTFHPIVASSAIHHFGLKFGLIRLMERGLYVSSIAFRKNLWEGRWKGVERQELERRAGVIETS